ncbi:MAG: sensor domain-containing diguanylate cyclase [Terracidiphilus sp.]|jgi:diguanylate cyclase (GGDEF)-like protein
MAKKTESRIPIDDLLVFHQVARSLTSSFDLDTILRTIIEHMERFIEAELWTLLMLDETQQELYYAIIAGADESALRNVRVKVGQGVAGWVVQHGETLLVPEALNDPRVRQAESGRPKTVRSVIALPLRGRKGTHGAIEIFNPKADQLTDYTIAFLHILADHAAIAIENAHDVARIQQLTITDDCTGLFNVRHLYEVLESEMERCTKRRPVSLAFIDLDHFKMVNDEHGHLVGSELLSRAGERIQELSREQDSCFRYGGDEFVILMPETGSDAALMQCAKLHRALLDTEFQMKNGERLFVSASMGVATAPTDAATVHALIGTADMRMYAVKVRGRGAVRGE